MKRYRFLIYGHNPIDCFSYEFPEYRVQFGLWAANPKEARKIAGELAPGCTAFMILYYYKEVMNAI